MVDVQNSCPIVRNDQAPGTPIRYSSVFDWPGEWVVLQTSPRQLMEAVGTIEECGVPCYLPCVIRARWYSHKSGGQERKEWSVPLFPGGYLFACVHDDAAFPREPREWAVSSIIRVCKSGQSQLRRELTAIQQALEIDRYAEPHPGIAIGKSVRVTHGPLMGHVGIVERIADRDRLVIGITMLGQFVSLDVAAFEVEAA